MGRKGEGWLWHFHSCGSASVGSPCRLSRSAAGLDGHSRGRQSPLPGELLISAHIGEQPGDALICVFGSHHPEGGQKRVRPSAAISQSHCSPERRQTLHLIRGLNPPSCRGASFGNRKMSAGGVCPSWLRCQPQGQPQPPPPCAGGLSCCFGLSTRAVQLWVCTCIPPSCAGAAVLLSQYSSAALRSQTGASATTDDLQQGGYICIKSPENLAQSCAQADPWAY